MTIAVRYLQFKEENSTRYPVSESWISQLAIKKLFVFEPAAEEEASQNRASQEKLLDEIADSGGLDISWGRRCADVLVLQRTVNESEEDAITADFRCSMGYTGSDRASILTESANKMRLFLSNMKRRSWVKIGVQTE